MSSWGYFEAQAPDLAAFGAERLTAAAAYLATVRRDGAPRVHPIAPIIGGGRLFVFMEPTSPNLDHSSDLWRDDSDTVDGAGELLTGL